YISAQLGSIVAGWEVVLTIGAGTGAVYLLRWYWWRINAWSEIAAMVTAIVVTELLSWTNAFATSEGPVRFAETALVTTVATTLAWVLATFLTKPEPQDVLLNFYRKVRPHVAGWQPIARLAPEVPPTRDLGNNLLCWVLGCATVYFALFGLGSLILATAW